MVINGKHVYDARRSPPTSTPSARPANLQASRRFKSAVLKLPHINQILHHYGHNNNAPLEDNKEDLDDEEERQPTADARRLKEKSLAFHPDQRGEKHHHQKNGKKKGGKKGYQYEGQYDRSGQQAQQQAQRMPSASKDLCSETIRGYDLTSSNHAGKNIDKVPPATQHDKHKKDYKRVSVIHKILLNRSLIPYSQAR